MIGQDFPWIRADDMGRGVWALEDNREDACYLVVGAERALLIDTGFGIGDMAQAVRAITPLPLLVVNTHGHPDHVSGNYQFPEVYIHPADMGMARRFCEDGAVRQGLGAGIMKGKTYPLDFDLERWAQPKAVTLLPVGEGHRFDLGDRQLEVLEIPGHSPGCIALLDAANGLLFPGDMVSTDHIFMHGGGLPLTVYLDSLIKLANRGSFDIIYPAHGRRPIEPSYLRDLIACAQGILAGSIEGEPCRTDLGGGMEGRMARYGKAYLIYHPDRLRP